MVYNDNHVAITYVYLQFFPIQILSHPFHEFFFAFMQIIHGYIDEVKKLEWEIWSIPIKECHWFELLVCWEKRRSWLCQYGKVVKVIEPKQIPIEQKTTKIFTAAILLVLNLVLSIDSE